MGHHTLTNGALRVGTRVVLPVLRWCGLVTADLALVAGLVVLVSVQLGWLHGAIDVVAQFGLQGALALALALGLTWRLARWWRATLAGTALLLSLPPLGLPALPWAAPWGHATAEDAPVLTVLVANLNQHAGVPPKGSFDAWLNATGADVVLFNEATAATRARFETHPGAFDYVDHCGQGLFCETMVLSRWPSSPIAYRFDPQNGGKVQLTAVTFEDTRFTFGVTHVLRPIPPGSPTQNLRQSEFIAEAVAGHERMVLTGDFNAVPWGRVMAMFGERAGLSGPILWQGTWPSWLPIPLRLHIDHVLVGCGVEVLSARTIRVPRSDHMAVLARLRASDAAC